MKDTTKKVHTPGPYEQIWKEWCHEIDRVIETPIQQGGYPDPYKLEQMFRRFGSWSTLKDEIDTCLNDENYYKNLYEDLQTEIENIKTDVIKVKDILEDITELDIDEKDEENNCVVSAAILEGVNEDIAEAIKKLDKVDDKLDELV